MKGASSGVARKIFLLRQRLATCIGRQVFGRERVRGTLGFYRGTFPQGAIWWHFCLVGSSSTNSIQRYKTE